MQIKSHFQFSKQQRNGIFLLLLLITIFQCAYFFTEANLANDSLEKEMALNSQDLYVFETEIEALKKIRTEASKPKIYPFNPNFITDFKGYSLGMTTKEIDRLLYYRKQSKWINSVKEFQKVTKVSDSLLAILSPNFKFPEWVTNPKKFNNSYSKTKNKNSTPKSFEEKIDLNTATAFQLKKVNGIGDKLSQRIIKYRNKQKGFHNTIELQEVYGLSSEVIIKIKNQFSIKSPRVINKINLNLSTRDELVTIRYIDYDIAFNIIEERTLRGGYKSIEDLKKVKDFPLNKFEIIKLYLQLD